MNESSNNLADTYQSSEKPTCSNTSCCPPAQSTVIRSGPKVGRNDPCVCGNGRKYKKCCGKNA